MHPPEIPEEKNSFPIMIPPEISFFLKFWNATTVVKI